MLETSSLRMIIRRDESAFTRGDKIMRIPWPAYRRPTVHEIREAREKAEREAAGDAESAQPLKSGEKADSAEDVDMGAPLRRSLR